MNLLHGDCLEMLRTLPDKSVDSVVTDPPAGISFMGKDWDGDKGGRKEWVAWMSEVMTQCHRVLKPGAHGLVWALPRTSHWTATALEDAGFEIRDVVTHLFGSGFPKSHNISKALGSDEWAGWGTALKPASEHWILVRKPCSEKTVAANVVLHGTGAINIDASRIGTGGHHGGATGASRSHAFGEHVEYVKGPNKVYDQGRFPANLVLSHSPHCTDEACDLFDCPVALLDKQSGVSKSKSANRGIGIGYGGTTKSVSSVRGVNDSGGASRFFYCAKISSSERNAGLEELPLKPHETLQGGNKLGRSPHEKTQPAKNNHPTVKPKKLMGYLIRMITPPGGIVLDPFMGSGSTGLAAKEQGFQFIGIEKEEEYFEISKARVMA